eukprot:TRINITY_DN2955_c0_g2_i1.p1 TRINITY_DN2955_c0_g2~~TRINITY_DN2955_c0_g2_i1.p1  ORF type:complete len:245 (-),score=34.30 TRINITY_DN2955_c0_g2_i1:352-1086(-)
MQCHTTLILALVLTSSARQAVRRPGSGRKGKIPDHQLSDASCDRRRITCDKYEMYRSISGLCNNLENPHLGAANSKISRFLAPEYYDCQEMPKGGYQDNESPQRRRHRGRQSRKFTSTPGCRGSNQSLPNAREVSSTFHSDADIPHHSFSLMVMQFGQFLDHDMALSPEVEEHNCCEHPETENCFPIYHPNDDPFYSDKKKATCQEFTRTDAYCSTGEALGSPESSTVLSQHLWIAHKSTVQMK